MSLDEDKLYMKIVVFIKIYNLTVQTFFIRGHFDGQIVDTNVSSLDNIFFKRHISFI
jgi:hypothetical protein